MSDCLLKVSQIRRSFPMKSGLFAPPRFLHAVNGVDLTIARGEILGVVGESGCGKSTLGRIITGLDRPTEGSITLKGRDVGDYNRRDLARLVHPIFQDPYSSLNPRRTIAEIIAAPLTIHGIGAPSERRQTAVTLLDRVGLPKRFAEHYPNQLSGGQRQRVAIARALVLNPELIVCDEPTSALDVSVQSQILNLLMDLRAEFNLTYLFISHNLAVVEHIASRVAVMYLGRIVETADALDLFKQPSHPYTQSLLASVLTPEPGLGVPETGLGTAFPDPTQPPPGCTFHPRCPKALPRCSVDVPVAHGPHHTTCHLLDLPS